MHSYQLTHWTQNYNEYTCLKCGKRVQHPPEDVIYVDLMTKYDKTTCTDKDTEHA